MIDQDTICAVSTPSGEGGIGIIRISGKNAIPIASLIFKSHSGERLAARKTHTIHYGHVVDPSTHETIEEALISVMHAPTTYTREDVVEINCHGGMMPLWRTMALLISSGARQAEPGEFTKRAFLNGRIDLVQAEAVMDVIKSKTDLSHRAANELLRGGLSTEISTLRDMIVSLIASVEASIDFPDVSIETPSGEPLATETAQIIAGIEQLLVSYNYGKILRDGYATAIVGKPNVGKSSLLNALLKQDRAIVNEQPGTTRDVLEEYLNISGVPLKILDTAGIRHSHDVVEQEGVRRSRAAIASADIVLVVLDGSEPLSSEDRHVLNETKMKNTVAVINKSDLPKKMELLSLPMLQIPLSCRTGKGLDDLKSTILNMIKEGSVVSSEHAWAVNQRHKTALEQARGSLQTALETIKSGLSAEFIALDLRGALDSLGLIIGTTYTEDILDRIFDKFCIGK